MHKRVLRISDEKTLQLINECKNEECLWNTHLIDYPNKTERFAAYVLIAEKLDIPDFKPHHVMVKFKNLRNSYCQELKKMGSDKKYKPKVFWFNIMDEFLRPHLQKIKSYTEKTKLLLEAEHDTNTEIDSEGQEDVTDWAIGNSIPSDASCSNSINIEYMFPEESKHDIGESSTRKRKLSAASNENELLVIKRSYSDSEENFIQSPRPADPPLRSDDLLTGITTTKLKRDEVSTARPKKNVSSAVSGKDHYDAFGNYIASLLRSLPPKKALLLQPKIVKWIVSVGIEDLSDDESA